MSGLNLPIDRCHHCEHHNCGDAWNDLCAELFCFYQSAHHDIIDEELLLDVASLLDEAALPKTSSPYVVASLDEAATNNEAALIDEVVLFDASIPCV